MHTAWHSDRPERVTALARFTALTLAQPASRPPPPPQPRSATSLPSPGACSSDVPRPSTGPALAQLPTMLKGQGPPATQSICQAAESGIREERDTNTRQPRSLLSKHNREMPDKKIH
ncbi:hypothetical protein NQZ68_001079 [Dissostichus eleginoides]|nr:hypothetical protein NQZ68_001079 [Dissostichus eleginoides]